MDINPDLTIEEHRDVVAKEIGHKANLSGKDAEDRIEYFLKKNDLPYIREKSGKKQIDFRIFPLTTKEIFADSKSMNVPGTADEKIPHTAWKYAKHYDTDTIYIVRGKIDLRPEIYEHLEEDRQKYGHRTIVLTELEFYKMMLGIELTEGEFF